MKRISIIAPAYNEEETLPQFHKEISRVMNGQSNYCWDIIYINDGSSDHTLKILLGIKREHTNVVVIDFSRNFGKEIAMSAGLDYATTGDAVVVIDTDLQDPPSLIPNFIKEWEKGADVVYAKRKKRHGETWLKKTTAELFYRMMSKLTRIEIPRNTGDFRLMSKEVVSALNQLREHHRFMKGLFSWVGFDQVGIEYERDPRLAGKTKFNYWKLWNFAIEGVTSFTSLPLRLATYIGTSVALIAFIYGLYLFIRTIFWGDPVKGYPSLMVTILTLGGINLIFLGLIGEYLGRMFNETKNRPLYITKQIYK